MESLSIKAKLTLLALFSLVTLALVGAAGLFSVANVATSLEAVSDRMAAVNALMGIRTWQLTSVTETKSARGWEFAEYDSLPDKDALAEANDFFGAALEAKLKADRNTQQFYDLYAGLPKTPQEAELWNTFQQDWNTYTAANKDIVGQLRVMSAGSDWNSLPSELATLRLHDDQSMATLMRTAAGLDKLLELNNSYSDQARATGKAAQEDTPRIIAGIFACAMLGLVTMAWVIVRNVVGSLQGMRQAIVRVAASNDFTGRAVVKGG